MRCCTMRASVIAAPNDVPIQPSGACRYWPQQALFAFNNVGAKSLARPQELWGSMNSLLAAQPGSRQPDAGEPDAASAAPAPAPALATASEAQPVATPHVRFAAAAPSTMGVSLLADGESEEDGIFGFRTAYVA